MRSQPTPSLFRRDASSASSAGFRPLLIALVAYVSAVSATVGAAAAIVGADVPLDVLIAVV